MKKNLTLKLDEALLKKCRHLAVESDQSVSEWVANLLRDHVGKTSSLESSKGRAKRLLQRGLKLDGSYLSREDVHERKARARIC